MKLHRQNRLRQVHVKIRIQQRVRGRICQIVPLFVAPGYDEVLRDRPAAVADVKKDKEMFKQRRRILAGQILHRTIRLKNAVSVADRECEWIGSLLQTHKLPQQHIALYRFKKRFATVIRNFTQRFFQMLKFQATFAFGSRGFFRC